MKEIWNLEWKRVWNNRTTWIVFGILMAIVLIDTGFYYEMSRDLGKYTYPDIFLQGWLPMDFQFVYGGLFRILFPLAAAMPFGASYYRDRTSGYIKNICTVCTRRNYYRVKYLVTYISGAWMVFLPLLISLMLSMTYLPILRPQPFAAQGLLSEGDAFVWLYYSHPVVYAGVYIVIITGFGGLSAVISLCISDRMKSSFAVLVLPVTVYLMTGALLEQFQMSIFSVYDMADPVQFYPTRGWITVITQIAGGVLTWWLFCKRKSGEDVL